MKVKFLGTASAEGMPAVFCACDTCQKARILKGKDIRTRSQLLVDGDLLVDFPMDTYMHSLTFDLRLDKIAGIFITHSHMDHCYPLEFILHGEPHAYNMEQPILNIFANETVIERAKSLNKIELKPSIEKSLNFVALSPFQTVEVSGKKITALPANHTKGENCYIYLIEKNGKSFLQFNDSGILDESVYEWLEKNNKKIDAVSFDCTYGYLEKGKGRHMGMLDNLNERTRMQNHNLVHPATKYIVTHFSHNCRLSHNELTEKAHPLNLQVAHDGMEIEV